MLCDAIREQLEQALGSRPVRESAVSGGCISPATRLTLADGRVLFVKTAPAGAAADMFVEEARSLDRLRATDTLRVPAVLAVDADWLALEWLEPARDVSAAERSESAGQLGRGLARLHMTAGLEWGWDTDNYIGPLPQTNRAAADWPEFWRTQRLQPQLERADRLVADLRHDFDQLLSRLDQLLSGAAGEPPSLLHGDLWNGNVHQTATGPALVDPASYYGHREVDLAMAALFGGFSPDFERAYTAQWPLQPGSTVRRAVYQLYYLLIHVNLFGASYVPATQRTLRTALS